MIAEDIWDSVVGASAVFTENPHFFVCLFVVVVFSFLMFPVFTVLSLSLGFLAFIVLSLSLGFPVFIVLSLSFGFQVFALITVCI